MTTPCTEGAMAAAAASGSRLTALRALRDRLAGDLDDCDSKRDVATLAQRLMDVLAQIDDLGGGVAEKKPETAEKKPETKLDEFTKRLRDREQPAPKAARRARPS